MLKSEAVELLGRDMSAAAEAVGISYQAVKKWPDQLPPRIADRVLGVCVRKGIEVPRKFLEPKPTQALTQQAQVAINSEAIEAAHGY